MPPKFESVQSISALWGHLAFFQLHQPEAELMATPRGLAWTRPLGFQHAACRQTHQKGHPSQAAPTAPTARTYPVNTPGQILPVPWTQRGGWEQLALGKFSTLKSPSPTTCLPGHQSVPLEAPAWLSRECCFSLSQGCWDGLCLPHEQAT